MNPLVPYVVTPVCRIHKFMDYVAKDIVGMSAYDFYHGSDVALIQGHHAKCKFVCLFVCLFIPSVRMLPVQSCIIVYISLTRVYEPGCMQS